MNRKISYLKKEDTHHTISSKRLLRIHRNKCLPLNLSNSETLHDGSELKLIDNNTSKPNIHFIENNTKESFVLPFCIYNISPIITPQQYGQKLIFDLKKIDSIINDPNFINQAPEIPNDLVKKMCQKTVIAMGQGVPGTFSRNPKITYDPFGSRINTRNDADNTLSYAAPDVTLFHEAIHFFNFENGTYKVHLNASRANYTNKEEEQTIYYENIYRTVRGYENRTAHADGSGILIPITPFNGTCTESQYLSPFNNSDTIMNLSINNMEYVNNGKNASEINMTDLCPQPTQQPRAELYFLPLGILPLVLGAYCWRKHTQLRKTNRFLDEAIPLEEERKSIHLSKIENIATNKKLPQSIRQKALSKLPEDRQQTLNQNAI